MKKPLLIILVLCNVVLLAGLLYFYFVGNKDTTVEDPNVVNATATVVTLPPDAVKISECIPFMGEHWVQPSKLPIGPFYVVYNGKVTGIEYMFTPDKIPGEKAAKMSEKEIMDYISKNNLTLADLVKANQFQLDTLGAKVHYMTIDWNSPHSGLAAPHYDVHAYLIDKAEASQICPEAKIEEVYSKEVLDNVERYKIPFPEAPKK